MGKTKKPETSARKKIAQRVAVAAGGGMSHEEIAIGLGMTREQLETRFAKELSVGAHEKRIEIFEGLHKAALAGNVAAAKAYTSLTPKVAPPPVPRAAKPKPEGKKEQQAAYAKVAQQGTGWEELLRPRNGAPAQLS